MQYVGGKQKSGGHRIAAAVKRYADRVGTRVIMEPMCGGLSVTYRLCSLGLDVHASDACQALITLYRCMKNGWVPPHAIDRAAWERYRAKPDPYDPMTAFVGFGCSRSGAWFSSFVDTYKYTARRVPAATAARDSLIKKLAACSSVEFTFRDYRDTPLKGVWYCDIPYLGTLGYPAVGAFDHTAFWACVEDASRQIPVLVSETQAHDGFVAIEEWGVQRRLNTPTATRRIERLFVHERWAS